MAKESKGKTKNVTGKRTAANGKGATIMELLRRKEGATLADLTGRPAGSRTACGAS